MGRGKTRTRTVAVQQFNALLGSHRGSAAAQTQRDADEQVAREHVLEEYAETIKAACSRRVCVDTLIHAYRWGWGQLSPEGETAVVGQLLKFAADTRPGELVTLVGKGDPVGWPGLTAPAVTALTAYLDRNAELEGFDPLQKMGLFLDLEILWAPGHCFAKARKAVDYKQMLPLCRSLAKMIVQEAADDKDVAWHMARTLRAVEVDAITGPLASWVPAFVERRLQKRIQTVENAVFQDVAAEAAQDPERALALKPILDLLSPGR